MKKPIRKIVSIILFLSILTQIFQISVYAVDFNENKTAVQDKNTDLYSKMPKIVCEVESRRDECKKDFLLEDGSFCSVITSAPIHDYSDGQWIEKNQFSKFTTVDKVIGDLNNNNSFSDSKLEQGTTRAESYYSEAMGLIIDWADNDPYIDNNVTWHILNGEETAFYIKSTNVGQYVSNDYLITSALFSVDCMLSDDPAESNLCGIDEWSDDYEDMAPNDDIYTKRTINSDSTYTFNLTDIFNKWEKGIMDNTGFAFMDSAGSDLMVANPCLIIRYIDADSAGLDFTFHSVDLSKSGTVYINDVTNNFKVKQNVLDYSFKKTDLSVYRTYDSAAPDINNYAGIKSYFNFESKLEINTDYAEWTMFDGSIVRFAPSDPPVTNNYYEIWDLMPTANTSSLEASLYLPLSPNSGLARYVLIDGLKYIFNTNGYIHIISDPSTNIGIMFFAYDNPGTGKIDYIEILDEKIIDFSYGNSGCVESIKIQHGDEPNIVVEQEVSLEYNSSNSQVTNNVKNGTVTVSTYSFDDDGRLLSAVNENGLRCEFNYAEYPDQSLGNYITGYELYNSGSNTVAESLTIDSDNTFKRIFTDIDGKEETIYYDSDYRIVTYIGPDGKYKYLDYDETGLISSYIFKHSDSDTELLLGSNFPKANLKPWTKGGDNPGIISRTNAPLTDGKSASFGFIPYMENTAYLYQNISAVENGSLTIFEADKTYVFGGRVYLTDVLPDLTKTITITVETAPIVNGLPSTNYTEYSKITFDNTLLGEWQYRLKAFKLEYDSVVRFKLCYNAQCGYAFFAKPTLFESREAITDLDDLVTSSPYENTYIKIDGKDRPTSETLTWERSNEPDITMSTSYLYDQNNVLREFNDFNGNSTYYQYNSDGNVSGKGHKLDNQGNIADVNALVYDAENVLASTTQIIKNIENNNNVTISAEYDEETVTENNETVTCVTVQHNGYNQVFKKNTDGMLVEIYSESTALPNDHTNYNIEYQYDSNNDIVQIDYSNGCRDVYCVFDNNDEYIYKCIRRCLIDGENTTQVKTYTYKFDDDGNLLMSFDNSTNILVDYENDGYSIYEDDGYSIYENGENIVLENNETDPVLIFSHATNNGDTLLTYSNTYYSQPDAGITPTYTTPDIVEISPLSTSLNNDGTKTFTSSVNVEKNLGEYISTAEYELTGEEDYFGRLTSKEAYVEHDFRSDMYGTLTVNEEYDYKDLGNGRTTGLVSDYSSAITGTYVHPDENNANIQTTSYIYSEYSRKYEYDHKGNVTFVYIENNNITEPKEYYEYDNANQIVTEINFEKQLCAHYTYNSGGNLTAKIYYNFSGLSFNVANRQIISLGQEIRRITYQYDTVWKDRMICYSDTGYTNDNEDDSVYQVITYDKMGNPLNYVGTNNQGEPICGTLEWQGSLLSAFESDDMRIEYQYDRNGFRTNKKVYNKTINTVDVVYSLGMVVDYLWKNGVLEGIVMSGIDEDSGFRENLMNVSFIYDSTGSPVGYMSLLGIPYLFKKDINDNVLSLVFPDGDEMFTYSYDSWGKATVTYSPNWSGSAIQSLIVYIIAGLCPMAYHGYLYDYETGMCFNKGRCYSPDWGRNINPEDYEKLLDRPENPLEANLYLFCKNNPLNTPDKTASWYRDYFGVEWKSDGFEVPMSDMFASRTICTVFANQLIKADGAWNVYTGYNYMGMTAEMIAADLFAHYVGKNAKAAINKVNAVWGDGWILKNSQSETIFVYKDDLNFGKYIKIWRAAPEIKAYAQKEGIFITL